MASRREGLARTAVLEPFRHTRRCIRLRTPPRGSGGSLGLRNCGSIGSRGWTTEKGHGGEAEDRWAAGRVGVEAGLRENYSV